jgi:hypothetical protein
MPSVCSGIRNTCNCVLHLRGCSTRCLCRDWYPHTLRPAAFSTSDVIQCWTRIHQVLDMTGAALVTDVGVGALAACSELRQLTLSW